MPAVHSFPAKQLASRAAHHVAVAAAAAAALSVKAISDQVARYATGTGARVADVRAHWRKGEVGSTVKYRRVAVS